MTIQDGKDLRLQQGVKVMLQETSWCSRGSDVPSSMNTSLGSCNNKTVFAATTAVAQSCVAATCFVNACTLVASSSTFRLNVQFK
jgi:hypothetical protein